MSVNDVNYPCNRNTVDSRYSDRVRRRPNDRPIENDRYIEYWLLNTDQFGRPCKHRSIESYRFIEYRCNENPLYLAEGETRIAYAKTETQCRLSLQATKPMSLFAKSAQKDTRLGGWRRSRTTEAQVRRIPSNCMERLLLHVTE